MGNSKQKIIEKLNCIPDDLSEEEIIERRMISCVNKMLSGGCFMVHNMFKDL